ncbi:hypothetical protein JCM11641_000101 [Rhodosporidiobolus odoratus]
MPKSQKHKAARKDDFKKSKLKLGKGKQVASNATNTSFSTKSIALPTQLNSATIKTAPTSRRNLTLPDLLPQTRHYSVPVKKEALLEISLLLESHPFLLTQHLLPLTTAVAHLIPDASASVRKGGREVLRFMCEHLTKSQLVSISPGIVLFTLSALSSLDEPVRIDALSVLQLLLNHVPEELVRGWDGTADVSSGGAELLGEKADERGTGAKVVEALLGMLKVRNLGAGGKASGFTSAAAGGDLSPSARLAVLNTLATFLRGSLSPSSATSSATIEDDLPWYLSTSFTTSRSYSNFLSSLSPTSSSSSSSRNIPVQHSGSSTSAPIESFGLAIEPFSSSSSDLSLTSFGLLTPPSTPPPSTFTTSSSTATPTPTSTPLLTLLHPLLLSSFLDAAPTAFSPSAALSLSLSHSGSSRGEAIETVEAVMGVGRELFYRALGAGGGGAVSEETGGDAGLAGVGLTSNGTGQQGKERKEARKALVGLLTHAAPYFPFGSDALPTLSSSSSSSNQHQYHRREQQMNEDERFLALNLKFAEMSSLLVLSLDGVVGEEGGKKKGKKSASSSSRRQEGIEEVVGGRVQEWVVGLVSGSLTTPHHPLGLPLPSASYAALEPTLWSLLNQPDPARANQVWEAVLGHSVRKGQARGRGWRFVARCILIQSDPSYSNRFEISTALSPSPDDGQVAPGSALGKWLAGMPKWLWELGAKEEELSESILRFLLKLAQQGEKGVLPSSALVALIPLVCPFFHLTHPTRGALAGPFTRLSSRVQGIALDLVVHLSGLAQQLGEGEKVKVLREAVGRAVEVGGEGGVRERWERVRGTPS